MKHIFDWLLPALFSSFFALRFGGDSDSQANTTSTSEQRDMRVVGGEGSTNLSANDSNVSVIATDHNAVSGGLNTANEAFRLATKLVGDNAKQNLDATGSMFAGALGTVSSARQEVAEAYKSATTPENDMLKIAGFFVVGIAAVGLFAEKMK